MSRGVILYGPPAAGKNTVTDALTALDPAYSLFERLKAGPGRTQGYRMTTHEALDDLRERGGVLWENERYDARYVVDQEGLGAALAQGVPVLHLGQVEALSSIRSAVPSVQWTVVYLWCSRAEAESRLIERGATDVATRLLAWDQTLPLAEADLTIDTGQVTPDDAAATIHAALAT